VSTDPNAAGDASAKTTEARGDNQTTSTNPTSTAGVDRLPPADGRAPAAARDISGSWSLITQVESSSLARFSGLQLGYELQLRQTGARVTGTGRKVTENNKALSGRARTRITVEGTIQDDQLALTFTERGARRPARGTFNLLITDNDVMSGRFASDAAKSSGRVDAHRAQ
jgi:hypothetical protein